MNGELPPGGVLLIVKSWNHKTVSPTQHQRVNWTRGELEEEERTLLSRDRSLKHQLLQFENGESRIKQDAKGIGDSDVV